MEKFIKYAKIAKKNDGDSYGYLHFKNWQNGVKHRIYVNDSHGRTIGYIDCNNKNEFVLIDKNGLELEEIESIVNKFNETYTYESEPKEIKSMSIWFEEKDNVFYYNILSINGNDKTNDYKEIIKGLGFNYDHEHDWHIEIPFNVGNPHETWDKINSLSKSFYDRGIKISLQNLQRVFFDKLEAIGYKG